MRIHIDTHRKGYNTRMRTSLADIKSKAMPALRGMALLILAIITFIVALWVLMALVRVILPVG